MIGLRAKYPWVWLAVLTLAVSWSPAWAQRDYPKEIYREILDAEFSAADVDIVPFQVANNGSQTLTDARLVDWKIRYGTVGPKAQAATPVGPPAEQSPRGWLMALLLIGGAILIAVALAAAFLLLNRRGAAKAEQ